MFHVLTHIDKDTRTPIYTRIACKEKALNFYSIFFCLTFCRMVSLLPACQPARLPAVVVGSVFGVFYYVAEFFMCFCSLSLSFSLFSC